MTPNELALLLFRQLVLFSGASRGLGAFLAQGARVVVNYINSVDAARAMAAHALDCARSVLADLRDHKAVQAMFATARPRRGTCDDPDQQRPAGVFVQWRCQVWTGYLCVGNLGQQMQDVSRGAFNIIQAALPSMRERRAIRVINIGTNLSENPAVPYHDYTAAKATLLSRVSTASHDLGPEGITVNKLPGGLLRITGASAAIPDAVFDLIAANTPLRWVTTLEVFANAALFLASPWGWAVTGQNLMIDGGFVKN